MADRRRVDSTNLSSTEGRPSNLAFYRPYWFPTGSIMPLDDVPVNRAEWFQLYGGYIFRTFSTGESTEFFDIPKTMRSYINERVEKIAKLKVQRVSDRFVDSKGESKRKINSPEAQLARWFEPPENPSLKLAVPPLHLSNEAWEQAATLAQKLMTVARRHPSLVRCVVLGYCYAATTHRHVIITNVNDADYAKMLFDLVEELHLNGPALRYVGYRAGSRQTDVAALVKAFGLPAAPHDHETANNSDSPARLNHIGVRVCWGDSRRPSAEWHQVAVLAAVTELWSCVTGTNGVNRGP
jgi:hypothetical protein